jgi:hypothetical protein
MLPGVGYVCLWTEQPQARADEAEDQEAEISYARLEVLAILGRGFSQSVKGWEVRAKDDRPGVQNLRAGPE